MAQLQAQVYHGMGYQTDIVGLDRWGLITGTADPRLEF